MASKSKRRRKVLGASCILAALIIAGSSFAWFTSKDEVTNRLSANADYDVSIIESFAPPANWIPGQEVNKDVYAVNTGNTAAFVEETVSGVLTVTKEEPDGTGDAPTPNANNLKLTKAERYSIEAGSYLAFAPTTSNHQKGEKVVAMTPDSSDLNGYTAGATDFTPDSAGLYVFRRKISVDPTTKVESFKYDGYYYDGHDYYKITNLSVVPEAASYAGDDDKTDGNLTSAKYKLVKEVSTTGVPTLKYDSVNKRLVATYNVGTANSALSTLAEAYDDALIAYQNALEEYEAAVRDNNQANSSVATENAALQLALNNLRTALNTLREKQAALISANNTLTTATEEKTAAENAVGAAMVALYGHANGSDAAISTSDPTGEANHYTSTSAYGKYKTAEANDTTAQGNVDDAMRNVYGYKDGGTTTQGDSQVDGSNSTGYYKSTSAYGEWKAAHDAVSGGAPSAATTFQTAFSNYVDEKWASTDPAVKATVTDSTGLAKVDLNTVTYAQLHSYNLGLNSGTPEYTYYELVVTEKQQKEALDAAEAALAAAQSAKAETAQRLIDATTAKTNAEGAVSDAMVDLYGHANGSDAAISTSDPTGEADHYTSTSAYGRYKTAEAGVTSAQSDVDTAMVDLYGHANGSDAAISTSDPTGEADHYTSASKYGSFKAAEDAYNTAVSNASGIGGTSANLTTARNNLSASSQTLAEAKAAYESASNDANPAANEIKININLSDDVGTSGATADKWQLLPTTLVDTDGNNTFDTARFYYTGILDAGETSSKLIDSVELDESVTNDMFKSFDFDLNVALKSAQIAYDADGKITPTAANSTLDANATVATPSSIDSAVNWTLK